MTASDLEDDNLSDVSLDEEDEELIWRVFYAPLEERAKVDKQSDFMSISEYEEDPEEGEDLTDLSDIGDPELVAKYRDLKDPSLTFNLSEEERKRLLMTSFSDEQMERFESYRRMTVNKPGVKKICNSVLGHSIAQNISVVLAGLSKLLLSEIITRAFEVQERYNKAKLIQDINTKKRQKKRILKSLENGIEIEVNDRRLEYQGDQQQPLQPEHIREAWRLYKLENSGTFDAQWQKQGEADGALFR